MLCQNIVTEGAREDENFRRLQVRIYATDPERLYLHTELDEQGVYYDAEIALDPQQAKELVDVLNNFIAGRLVASVTTPLVTA